MWVVFTQMKEHEASFHANTTAVNETTLKPTQPTIIVCKI